MANKVWSLTISALGANTGPFKITDNFGTVVANNVSKASLLGGTTVTVVSTASSLTVTDLSACGLSKTISLGTGFVATRSGSFTRNNCAVGEIGSTIVFNNTYTSSISQAAAEALANANFNTDGQAYANANGVCTTSVINCFEYKVRNNNNFLVTISYKQCDTSNPINLNIDANSFEITTCAIENSIQLNDSNIVVTKQSNC